MKKLFSGIILIMLLTGVASLTVHMQKAWSSDPFSTSATTTMRVSPGSVSANLSETFSISVIIENVVNMSGYQFYVYWNKSLLENTQGYNSTSKTWVQDPSTPPSQWGPNKYYVGANEIANMTDGRSRYWIVLLATPVAPVNGTFSVVTLNFKVIDLGQTLLDLDHTIIGDQFAQAIAHTVVDGIFTSNPIPEFHSAIILLLLMIITTIAVVYIKRTRALYPKNLPR